MTHPNDTVSIPLSGAGGGHVAVIDRADLPLVEGHTWIAVRAKRRVYAITHLSDRTMIFMHRLLLGDPVGDIDHWDRDGLNNRRSNLRVASRSQNMANGPKRPNNKSGFKGVSWHAGARRWRVTIKQDYRQTQIGYFDDPAEGARAYDAKALELFGEFAHLNFPSDSESKPLA